MYRGQQQRHAGDLGRRQRIDAGRHLSLIGTQRKIRVAQPGTPL